jgi:hypothetical protein
VWWVKSGVYFGWVFEVFNNWKMKNFLVKFLGLEDFIGIKFLVYFWWAKDAIYGY